MSAAETDDVLEQIRQEPIRAAVRYAPNEWEALTRFLEDGDLEIDNGAAELSVGNWTFLRER